MGISKTPNVDYRGKPRKDYTMKNPATLTSLNLTYFEELFVHQCEDAGWTEDQIFCFICEDRERREKIRVEDAMSDWYDNRY